MGAKRREDFEIKRLEGIKRHREYAREGREFIARRLQELQTPSDIEHRVVDMVWSKAGLDGLGGLLSEVTAYMVDECYRKAKADIFGALTNSWLERTPLAIVLRDKLRGAIVGSSRPWMWTALFRASTCPFPRTAYSWTSLKDLVDFF